MVLKNKNGRVTVTQTSVFNNELMEHVSAQIGHYHLILEEYTDGDRIRINYNARVKFCLAMLAL